MNLLTTVGEATRKREIYFQKAIGLANRAKDLSTLENWAERDAKGLVRSLRDKHITWPQFEERVLDETLISALSALYLGAKEAKPEEKMKKAWPIVVGDMLPPMVLFLAQTKIRIDDGTLVYGDSTLDFSDLIPDDILDDPRYDTENPEIQEALAQAIPRGLGQTWAGLASRVVRYISTPVFSFFALGDYLVHEEQGYREMRRNSRGDKRVCHDCIKFAAMGWQPIGSLPMPGRQCRCHDRCRCQIDYR